MKKFIALIMTLFSLSTFSIAHALVTSSTPADSGYISSTPGLTTKSPTVTTSASTYTVPVYSSDVWATECGADAIQTGFSVSYGSYGTYNISSGVYYDWFTGNHSNTNVTLLTDDGARTITCRTAALGYN